MYSYIYDLSTRMIVSQLWVRDEQLSNGVGITDYPFTKI